MPYPHGTLVVDLNDDRLGELQGVIEERTKDSDKLVRSTAYVRPKGGGVEWEAPLSRIRPAGEISWTTPPSSPR